MLFYGQVEKSIITTELVTSAQLIIPFMFKKSACLLIE